MPKDTIIIVGQTRLDSYENLWVTPAGGGDEVKIGEKRAGLHALFQQGKAVMLHWETYKNRLYVADAKAVEGELPEPKSSQEVLPKQKEVIEKARASVAFDPTRKSIERQTALKAAVEWCVAKHATEPIKTAMVITVAGLFESYLENGIQVEKKK